MIHRNDFRMNLNMQIQNILNLKKKINFNIGMTGLGFIKENEIL